MCRSCAVISLPRNFANGASQIKIMIGGGISSEKGPLFAPQYTDAEIRAAVEEAATRDTYVAVHVYHADHIRRALEQGVMSIEHGQFIDEPTARLLKEKGAFISPYTAGLTPEGAELGECHLSVDTCFSYDPARDVVDCRVADAVFLDQSGLIRLLQRRRNSLTSAYPKLMVSAARLLF